MTVVRAGHTARRAVENQGHRSVDRSGRRWMVCSLTRLVHRSAELSTEPSPDVGRVAPRQRGDCPQGCTQVYPRFSVTQATWVRSFVMFLAVWTEPALPQKPGDPAVPAGIRPELDPVGTPPRPAIRRRRRRCGGHSTAAIKSATRAGAAELFCAWGWVGALPLRDRTGGVRAAGDTRPRRTYCAGRSLHESRWTRAVNTRAAGEARPRCPDPPGSTTARTLLPRWAARRRSNKEVRRCERDDRPPAVGASRPSCRGSTVPGTGGAVVGRSWAWPARSCHARFGACARDLSIPARAHTGAGGCCQKRRETGRAGSRDSSGGVRPLGGGAGPTRPRPRRGSQGVCSRSPRRASGSGPWCGRDPPTELHVGDTERVLRALGERGTHRYRGARRAQREDHHLVPPAPRAPTLGWRSTSPRPAPAFPWMGRSEGSTLPGSAAHPVPVTCG
ncbi:hypothetical protein CLV68_0700 [Actinokineospora cianjurensis]|uniref:Uncharacterized protein n=1 Tax=Actinokineospora cianjurensis TaxID=585224 RepID=A0A421B7C1_9PSEU|nr:hypothetical protein CLV68_0700 [Actinokineospora cianjurensis]